jgi:RNA 2',3'-cyclic 3'-phosphodiesterase
VAPGRTSVRAFVAVFPPPEVRETLARAARKLPVSGEVRWVRPANVHLTLKFLGDVAEADLSRVAEVLETIRGRHEPFEVALSGFGAFPSGSRARIFWAGIGEGSERLHALARDVELSLEPLGFEREARPYTPHLTLGRARGRPASLDTVETSEPGPHFWVRRLELMKSVFDGGGAEYSTLAAFPF